MVAAQRDFSSRGRENKNKDGCQVYSKQIGFPCSAVLPKASTA